jgi:hypothetical protein
MTQDRCTTWDSFALTCRKRRFRHVKKMIEAILAAKGSCRILDLGGERPYWDIDKEFLDAQKGRLSIVLVNLSHPAGGEKESGSCFERQTGDVTDPEVFKQNTFDLIHSNSVIEHVGSWQAVRKMANLIREQNKPYFVQTPNYWFPIEPHFHFFGFQWMPKLLRARLLRARALGTYPKAKSYDEAMRYVDEINLLTYRQMVDLFPNAALRRELFFGLTKSIMAIYNG